MYERLSDSEQLEYAHLDHDSRSNHADPYLPGQVVVQNEDELLTIHDVARRAGVTRAAVLSWIRNGFISAQTSSAGWVIRAGDIEAARRNAEDARLGLYHRPEDRMDERTSTSDSERVGETTSAILPIIGNPRARDRQMGDNVFAPLAEFVRDQADVVQEQAETIGWLQAELRRAREHLEARDLQASPQSKETSAGEPSESELTLQPDHDPVAEQEAVDVVEAEGDSGAVPESDSDDTILLYSIIEADPFSEEASRARMMIEETERKIAGMWDEQETQRTRHTSTTARTSEEASWLSWLTSPWKRRDS